MPWLLAFTLLFFSTLQAQVEPLDPICGIYEVVYFTTDNDSGDWMYSDYTHIQLHNGSWWRAPWFCFWFVDVGDTVEIIAIQENEEEYNSGRRYWMIQKDFLGQNKRLAFYSSQEGLLQFCEDNPLFRLKP